MRSCEAKWALVALMILVAACQRAPVAEKKEAAEPSAEEAGYVAPPELFGASRADGRLTLTGRAPAGSTVRLDSPDGSSRTAAVDASGAWTMVLTPPTEPAMFAFSAVAGDRTLRGEGAVLLTPAPGPAALLLRAGFGALALGQAEPSPRIVAIDYDANGGAAVAGLADKKAAVQLNLDGTLAGRSEADENGHFAVMAANRNLASGARRIEIDAVGGRDQVTIDVSKPAPLKGAAYRASRISNGWRIDWAPTGGGVQTTLVFTPQSAGS